MKKIWFLLICLSSAISFAEEPRPGSHHDLSWFTATNGEQHPIRTLADWQLRKREIRAGMQLAMGPLSKPETPVPLAMEVLETHPGDSFVRLKIRYQTDSPERWIHAWLFRPKTDERGKRPAVLCLHQTTGIGKGEPAGLGGNPNLHYAAELAARGFVTLAPDYPSFGEYEYDFAADDYISGTMKAIYDNIRAVDLLQSLDDVDGEGIGCIGHSLGGHNTMFTMAFEPRIKAGVSCCGFTRFHKYYEGKLQGWTSDRYMPRIRTEYGNDPDQVPFDFPEIVASFAPRAFLAVAPERDSNFEVSGVRDCIAAALPIYRLHEREHALRAIYPDAGHDFPEASRKIAYEFLAEHLTRE